MHKGGLKPDPFHFISAAAVIVNQLIFQYFMKFYVNFSYIITSSIYYISMLEATRFSIYRELKLFILLCLGLCTTINIVMAVNKPVTYTNHELLALNNNSRMRLPPAVYQRIKDLQINAFTRGCWSGTRYTRRIKTIITDRSYSINKKCTFKN